MCYIGTACNTGSCGDAGDHDINRYLLSLNVYFINSCSGCLRNNYWNKCKSIKLIPLLGDAALSSSTKELTLKKLGVFTMSPVSSEFLCHSTPREHIAKPIPKNKNLLKLIHVWFGSILAKNWGISLALVQLTEFTTQIVLHISFPRTKIKYRGEMEVFVGTSKTVA